MGVEDSHDDVVITEVKKKVKVWCEIGGTAGHSGDVDVMNVDGHTVEGCRAECRQTKCRRTKCRQT